MKATTISSRRWFAFGATAALIFSFAYAAAANQKIAAGESQVTEPGTITLRGVHAKVMSGSNLAYEIVAETGLVDEETRDIRMLKPTVRIYDQNGELQDRVVGQRGTLKRREVSTQKEDGTVEVVSKYDWELVGEVLFESARGYRISAPSLFFDHTRDEIYSDTGVSYRIPMGGGGLIEGTAREFRTRLEDGTNAIRSWSLIGNVELSSEKES